MLKVETWAWGWEIPGSTAFCMKLSVVVFNMQKYVQMSALDDKDVPSAEQWNSAVKFMTSAVQKEIKVAEANLGKLVGPTSFYDRWLKWRSQSETESKRLAIAEELTKFLNAESVRYMCFVVSTE